VLASHELPAYSPLAARDLIAACGRRIARGPRVLATARTLLAGVFRADDVLLVDSGRSALQLAIDIAHPARGDRIVALPAFQCYEVASAAVGAGCRVALYDIDPGTLQPKLDSLERAFADGARCVVIAPLYGVPVDWDAVTELAARHGATVIEDAAQSHGAEWCGRPVGSFGALSVLSFGRGKGWTGGRGGALLIRSASLAARAREINLGAPAISSEIITWATTVLQLAFGRSRLYGLPASIPSLGLGETRYHDPQAPTAALPYAAALLRETSASSTQEVMARRRNARAWSESLPTDLAAGIPRVNAAGIPGYLRFPVCLRADLVAPASGAKARRAGVARSYPLTLAELPAISERLVAPRRAYAGAHTLSRRMITLPTHSRLTPAGRDAILALFSEMITTLPRTTHETQA
jgi:dTDP-4-amino-4,6-dideoxygalactose transaminase